MEMPFLFGNQEDIPSMPLVEKWSKLFGYVHARRCKEQSAQNEFLNSQMLQQIISNNRLSVVFQNEARSQLGKSSRLNNSDLAIKWIIDSYLDLKQNREINIVLVPVMISYDRLLEANYVAEGVFEGTKHP